MRRPDVAHHDATAAEQVADPFDPDVLAAVARHMNTEHQTDTLHIARTIGGAPDAASATVVKLDASGAEIAVEVGDGQRTVRLPWTRPIRERQHFRREFVRMYHEAVASAPDRAPDDLST